MAIIREEYREEVFSLFDESITFSPAANRYYDIITACEKTKSSIMPEVEKWYQESKKLETVLSNGEEFIKGLIAGQFFERFYPTLKECGVENCSKDEYVSRVFSTQYWATYKAQILSEVEASSSGKQREASRNYNSQNRNTYIRNNNGEPLNPTTALIGLAVVGVVAAGTYVFDATKSTRLYKSKKTLDDLKGIVDRTITTAINEHIDIINGQRPSYINCSCFDAAAATELFISSKEEPNDIKRSLTNAFRVCPWHKGVLTFIYENFPSEEDCVAHAVRYYNVDLSEFVEKALNKRLNPDSIESLEEAEELKASTQTYLKKFGVVYSPLYIKLEIRCLNLLCGDISTCDEDQCISLRRKVESYDTSAYSKQGALKTIEKRLFDIWDEEDFSKFRSIYLNTDIRDQKDIERSILAIESQQRSPIASEFLGALRALSEDNIIKAQSFHSNNKLTKLSGNKSTWELLTINDTVVHPALLVEPPENQANQLYNQATKITESIGGTAKNLIQGIRHKKTKEEKK